MLYRNQVMDAIRKQNNERKARIVYTNSQPLTNNAVEEFINFKEKNLLLHHAMHQLPKCRRQILEMTLNNMEHAEIVKQLGIRPRTVWNQLNKARTFVKEKVNNK